MKRKRNMALRYSVYKITEMRGGCVYKTKHIRDVWVSCYVKDHQAIAKQYGGDMLAASTDGIKWIDSDAEVV